VTHPFENRQLRPICSLRLNRKSWRKSSIIVGRTASRSHAFQQALSLDEVRTLPLNPPKGSPKANLLFLQIKFTFNRIKSATKFLCVKTFSGKVVTEPFPYLMV